MACEDYSSISAKYLQSKAQPAVRAANALRVGLGAPMKLPLSLVTVGQYTKIGPTSGLGILVGEAPCMSIDRAWQYSQGPGGVALSH